MLSAYICWRRAVREKLGYKPWLERNFSPRLFLCWDCERFRTLYTGEIGRDVEGDIHREYST